MVPTQYLKLFALSMVGFVITAVGFLAVKYTGSVNLMDFCLFGIAMTYLPLLVIFHEILGKLYPDNIV